ncbi:rust resistance kinase Lr10-like isoform X2 [Macadamia integrifolia]|uniref:rust resistance kinase Lr10-like isoform X2 n=1 Tax=Macadamia integrifolia TaxID=60698 RepID=UPI001C4EF1CB|nr:rust resistance kinase Lr10-like isoform X2 [Macadamia integrifolia]XP_042520673.1 rust resistance kinase Lr10-like isoform X2 [Macadamia integrifolia]XP_042520681.1 rust resistance kinase Lr10-like isoform X2 [Macadamia integrifolia]XP_042520686.1 rust resistance kinase Lr10-like isoform X2 [Macadamia integrifolia]
MRELMMIIRFLFLFLCFLHLLPQSLGKEDDCKPWKCQEHGPIIEFPFRLKDQQPEYCGYPGFELTCKDRDTILQLPSVGELSVLDISYSKQSIKVQENCLAEFILGFDGSNSLSSTSSSPFHYFCNTRNYKFFDCPTDITSDNYGFYQVPCLSYKSHTVGFMGLSSDLASSPKSCTIMATVAVPIVPYDDNYGCTDVPSSFDYPNYLKDYSTGLSLKWEVPGCNCSKVGENCRFKNKTTQELGCFKAPPPWSPNDFGFARSGSRGGLKKDVAIGVSIAMLVLIAATLVVSIKIYKSRKLANEKAREDQLKVEKFLEEYKSLKPTRYSYSEIKKMTKQFKCKLGQGGYGSVFKGKLSNGILVAVKILKELASDGDDFINEVGTIGRIHHVNVVRLLGYCADGYKRALIYEFMPNESLAKLIFSEDANHPLQNWEKLQDIAIGIARGIEYLHQGCEQSILHFDIKPHNILLDRNFNPKISDFGLAKLCAKGQSNVPMTAARGTMGYIAPEVFSWNFGNVSHKSDVYSFGMLLLEMVGGRKNIDASVEHSSQAYFPEWIYNRLHQGEELGLRIVAEDDAEIARRLAIVATWCIQWYPTGRPSMKTVLRMLEGETGNLEMPPNPFVSTAPGEAEATILEESQGPNLAVITE